MRIAETFFHLSLTSGYWKMYTIVIQLGAILCVPIYFRSRIARLVTSFVVAYGAVAWFVAYIQRRGLAPFAISRMVLGLFVLWFASGIGG